MNAKRLYYTMLAAIAILTAGLVAGAYEADQMLAQQSKRLTSSRLQSAVLARQQDDLIRAKQEVNKYQDLAAIAKSVVPQDKDQAQAVREIVKIANANGIKLGSIAFPSSTLGGVTGSGSSSSTSSGKAKLSQLTTVKGIPGVYDLQITVQSDSNSPVPYNSFINFLSAIERNRRTALVSSVTIQPNSQNRNTLSFTLILDEFIKP